MKGRKTEKSSDTEDVIPQQRVHVSFGSYLLIIAQIQSNYISYAYSL